MLALSKFHQYFHTHHHIPLQLGLPPYHLNARSGVAFHCYHPTNLFSFINLLLDVIYLTSPSISSLNSRHLPISLIQLGYQIALSVCAWVCVWFKEAKVKLGLAPGGLYNSFNSSLGLNRKHTTLSLVFPNRYHPLLSHPTQPPLPLCAPPVGW